MVLLVVEGFGRLWSDVEGLLRVLLMVEGWRRLRNDVEEYSMMWNGLKGL